jgi:hypothetical protein
MAATKVKSTDATPPTVGGDAVKPLRHFEVVWETPMGSAHIDWEAVNEEQVRKEFLDHCARALTITPK